MARLGDTVYYITKYTGIKYIVTKLSKLFNKDCVGDKRREQWNDIEY